MSVSRQPSNASEVAERYLGIQRRVGLAAKSAGRDPAAIKLIVVTKTFEAEDIRPVLEQGHRAFGENRVQEAMAKWPTLRGEFPDIELHLIGPLQSNKAREAVAAFDVIHTLDRAKLATSLATEMRRQGKFPRLLIQVNTGLEIQKAGLNPTETAAFATQCKSEHGLEIAGLMCIPPVADQPAPHFDMLRRLCGELGLADLSMGMSTDFETAIVHGATMVRVGSAIFGSR